MGETRLEKYRKYRESLNEVKVNSKTDAANEMRKANTVTEKFNTTSTLPLDEVLGQVEDDGEKETVSNRIMTRKKIQIIIMIAAGVILTAVLVVIGIIVFRG